MASDLSMAHRLAGLQNECKPANGKCVYRLEMQQLRERIEEVMRAKGWTSDSKVAEIAGVSRSAVAQWRGKGSKEIKSIDLEPALRLEAASGYSARWISSGLGVKLAPKTRDSDQFGQPPRKRGSPAHILSQSEPNLIPSYQWGEIVPDALPEVFTVALPDDAMAPDAPAGSVVTFAKASSAESGDGVLVKDKDGGLYFRQFRARTLTSWQAMAKNPDYLPLESEADGLGVVAVMTDISIRRSGSKI